VRNSIVQIAGWCRISVAHHENHFLPANGESDRFEISSMIYVLLINKIDL